MWRTINIKTKYQLLQKFTIVLEHPVKIQLQVQGCNSSWNVFVGANYSAHTLADKRFWDLKVYSWSRCHAYIDIKCKIEIKFFWYNSKQSNLYLESRKCFHIHLMLNNGICHWYLIFNVWSWGIENWIRNPEKYIFSTANFNNPPLTWVVSWLPYW